VEETGHRLIPSSTSQLIPVTPVGVPVLSSDEPVEMNPFLREMFGFFLLVFATDLASETNWSMVSRSGRSSG